VAFWGHGRNLQSTAPTGLRERWKRWFVNRVDWWFAYTDSTRSLLRSDGFPDERITVLNNAIDNDRFAQDLAAVDDTRMRSCLERLGAQPGAPIGMYCGSLYPDKRLDLLVAAADLVHGQRPDFRLLVIGDGPSRSYLTEAAAARPWLICVGVQRGTDKAAWFRVANAYLSPGAVGLHVLDAFCAGLPMITTRDARHGPEIAYLEPERNGFVVDANAQAIAESYLALLRDAALLARVRSAAADDARRYTLDAMVRNFVAGIERCLQVPPLHSVRPA
jgi:glycosyltransferase involved in cell wall biosynthesis